MPLLDTQAQVRNTVAFRTIGCRLNQCETAQMQEALLAEGYRLVDWEESADIRVINTCTVTSRSDKTCRNEIRSAKRLDPGCVVAVTGCYAQVRPDAVAAIPGVDLVLGNTEKPRLAEHLAGRLKDHPAVPEDAQDGATIRGGGATIPEGGATIPEGTTPPPLVTVSPYVDHPSFEGTFFSHFYGYTRAFLKIQTGCDSRCAYCVIPLARGPARSMPRAQVLEQVRLLVSRDHHEVVLTGIDLGSWGRDTGEGSLADLLAVLLDRGGAGRYRLSSIEPLETDEALQDVIQEAGDRVAHHFHLPLQSGSDSVLSRMGRPYTAAQYLEVVTRLADRFPNAALGADVIAGFPGETDREFEDTLAFIEHAPFTYLHVFSYSDRPGTPASAMQPKVHPDTIHDRSVRLRALGMRKKETFRRRLTGMEQRALVLRERHPDGRLVGLTGSYQEVLLSGDDTLMNRFARVRLDRALPDDRWEAGLLWVEEPA
ncbi:MAG: tRNA (N(6)-L-threonylcarbamoyladenosine(37)-C(2))-methylthiotransferase MtaB [Actinomycetia bacterium]|nr:tRNA (N(6)-L-threonylcarbamoyladenosine(37)-C(2))-methylthiotransferase MtaB [Actinomycetes bacterium]